MANFSYKKAPALSDYGIFEGATDLRKAFEAIDLDIPCAAACPAHTNVPVYIEKIFKGDPAGAYAINLEDNIFPAALGRICTRPCESGCRHNSTDTLGPVTICHLKRYSSHTLETATPPADYFSDSGRSIAIIGAGPAGLAAAREAARLGHSVTLFERREYVGGMLIDGIPRFRLPQPLIESEAGRILNHKRVTLQTGETVDAARINELAQNFDAVIVAVGTVSPIDPGIDTTNALSGLNFMYRYNRGEIDSLEGDSVVIGGGFTAVDCARASVRSSLKSKAKVTMIYRRSRSGIAADEHELTQMAEEGVVIAPLVAPVAIIVEEGIIVGIQCVKNRLDRSSIEGKPRFIAIEGSEFIIPCKRVIVAIGQSPDLTILPAGVSLVDATRTTHPSIFVAGDFRIGSKDVISAVADGKRVARTIDTALMGKDRLMEKITIDPVVNNGRTGRVRNHDTVPPEPVVVTPLATRLSGSCSAEVESTLEKESAEVNASRCYLCHYKFEIDNDLCIQCKWCTDVCPRNCISAVNAVFTSETGTVTGYAKASSALETTYIRIDSTDCIRCGRCLRVCPTGAISMRKVTRITEAI